VEFVRDGQVQVTDNTVPYSYTWTPNASATGNHTFVVTPISSSGLRGTPVTVTCSVVSATPTPTPTP